MPSINPGLSRFCNRTGIRQGPRLPILLAIFTIQLNRDRVVKQGRIAKQSKGLHQNPEKFPNCLMIDIRLRSQNPKPWRCRHNLLQSWESCITILSVSRNPQNKLISVVAILLQSRHSNLQLVRITTRFQISCNPITIITDCALIVPDGTELRPSTDCSLDRRSPTRAAAVHRNPPTIRTTSSQI